MSKRTVHLICNAHLDPVWLWEWQEGAAEAISTFRSAADFCEEFDGFVFNHNEVILYRWVEEYEPALFARIQKLVREGKWHIMGGWYLQPDCNMPSGESFVRQMLAGRAYFQEKFGAKPTTAINFDPFGHTRGLVQILAKSGYDSYLFCRPGQGDCSLPDGPFAWVGYDGSQVTGLRADEHYLSAFGQACEKIEGLMTKHPQKEPLAVLWGVGNHGGGPSRVDLKRVNQRIHETKEADILHSTPEEYFRDVRRKHKTLPRVSTPLNPWGVGCYTSQVRIKQMHRLLENEYYSTEKMTTVAMLQGLLGDVREELNEAMRNLLFAEFHDILPGSSIQPVEEMSLRVMNHGLEILSRVKARAFFAMAAGQKKAKEGEIPVLAYNPHPFPVEGTFECEFQLANANQHEVFTDIHVCQAGKRLPTQVENEASNISLDWRKRVVFHAKLAPGQMCRFDSQMEERPVKPAIKLKSRNGVIRFKTREVEIVINTRTGLVDRYRVGGVDMVAPGTFAPVVMKDDEDPWGMRVQSYNNVAGRFRLMSARRSAAFSGVKAKTLPAVRVIEDGAVRSVVEAVFEYGDSMICQHYLLPKHGTELGIQTRVHWNEKDRMLKLFVPTPGAPKDFLGQVAYGVEHFPCNGKEMVAQKWLAMILKDGRNVLTCINDGVYGSHADEKGLSLTLLRSPGYSAHPIQTRDILPQHCYSPRIDQGERLFRFWFNGGGKNKRLHAIDREALAKNESPIVLSFFPCGAGTKPKPLAVLSDDVLQITAMKFATKGKDVIVRVFNPSDKQRTGTLAIPALRLRRNISLGAFEIRTLRISARNGAVRECDLMETPLR